MKSSVIHLKNVDTLWICRRKLLKEPLIALGIDMGKLPEKGLTSSRFNGTVKPESFEQPLPLPNRFDSTSGDQSSDQGMQPKAALISSKVANRAFNLPSFAVMLVQQLKVAREVCAKASLCSLFCWQF